MLKPIKRGLVYTNTNCTGCNKCIKACGVMGACIATDVLANENSFIKVDGDRCIACGACESICDAVFSIEDKAVVNESAVADNTDGFVYNCLFILFEK